MHFSSKQFSVEACFGVRREEKEIGRYLREVEAVLKQKDCLRSSSLDQEEKERFFLEVVAVLMQNKLPQEIVFGSEGCRSGK